MCMFVCLFLFLLQLLLFYELLSRVQCVDIKVIVVYVCKLFFASLEYYYIFFTLILHHIWSYFYYSIDIRFLLIFFFFYFKCIILQQEFVFCGYLLRSLLQWHWHIEDVVDDNNNNYKKSRKWNVEKYLKKTPQNENAMTTAR